jgi:hypothetical protein
MSNILLSLLLTTTSLILLLVLVAFSAIRRIFAQGKAFITPESEGKPSALANVTQVAADMLGRGVTAQLKATFMGKQSVDVRNGQRIASDIAVDGLSMSNPLIGAVLQQFPTLTKRLAKNPALLDMALQALAGGVKAPGPAPSNGETKFNL